MITKKKNALFGRYPLCDMLNNALRFLMNGRPEEAVEEIALAISEADGYFHDDVAQFVEDVKKQLNTEW